MHVFEPGKHTDADKPFKTQPSGSSRSQQAKKSFQTSDVNVKPCTDTHQQCDLGKVGSSSRAHFVDFVT